MAPYIRSLGITQLLTNGNEGYRAHGKFDPNAPISFPFNNWLNTGQKGAEHQLSVPRSGIEKSVAGDSQNLHAYGRRRLCTEAQRRF